MKSISLWQPWASLIAHERKHYETRSWPLNFRGPIAIHAAKRPVKPWELNSAIDTALVELGYRNYERVLPYGCIVCIANVVDCVPTEEVINRESFKSVAATERHFGDYRPGRWAWQLDNIVRVDNIPAQGKQGIWDWKPPADIAETLDSLPLFGQ